MSANSSSDHNIIIIKRKKGHAGHHGGAWKVAYADFVTAMMAFFLVMWIMGQNEKIKENIASYFLDPVGYGERLEQGILEGSEGVMEEMGSSVSASDEAREDFGDEIRLLLEQAEQEIAEAIIESPELQEFAELITLEMVTEGLRIELQEASESTFFDLGSARLSPNGMEAIETIAGIIGDLQMDIAVEGHTDSRPYNNTDGSYTNWELSADRANTARRILTANGVDPNLIVGIRGFADTKLKYPEDPLDPRNRRITIIIFNKVITEAPQEPDFGENAGAEIEEFMGE